MKPKKMYYLNGTHWDREWYKTFQGFRYLLMNVLDEVVETLENDPSFQLYILDGQTAVLDDYLEISPEMRPRLERLIQAGRIAVGPWYTMPDEFIPSGESLIRNLLMGHRKALDYGAKSAMKYGYICDIFGHIAQLPQILEGFDIHGALIQRGCNMDTTPPHFVWEAPNGSRCVVYRTPEDFGYGWFYHYATEPYNQGWDRSLDKLLERAIHIIDRESESMNLPIMVLNDALDHQHITKAAPWLAQKLEAHYGAEVVFRPLNELAQEQMKYADQLPVRRGELAETSRRDIGTNILLTHVVSSRYDLKKANDQVQTLWEKWAEPLSAIHAVTGRAIRPGFRKAAYLELIRNHAHDSICGCAVEEVHRDMHYRFRQASAIAAEVIDDCLRQDVKLLKDNDKPEKMIIRIMNPLPYAAKQTIKTRICFERNFPSTFSEGEREYERRNNFDIQNSKGQAIQYTLCGFATNRIQPTPTQYVVDYADVCFEAELAPCGYTEYAVIPAEKGRRVRHVQGQCVEKLTAENPYLRLHVAPTGTVTVTDKRSGRIYQDLLQYVDGADIGDGWMHIRPVADRYVHSDGAACIIEKLYDGPTETAFQITKELKLPRAMDYSAGTARRSAEYVTVSVCTTVRLGSANAYVDVQVRIDNRAMDHRLKVLLPTDIPGDTYLAGQAFTMLERPVGPDVSTGDWKEPQYGDRNFNGIAAKRAPNGDGIAFVSAYGLHEIEAMADERGTLAVTLFRSFAKTVGNNDYDQMDGQLLQPLEFSFRILPLTAEVSEGQIVRQADFLQTGIRQYTALVDRDYALGQKDSFLKLEGDDFACSIIKVPEDDAENEVVVRLYNCSDRESKGALRFARPLDGAWQTDLLESPVQTLAYHGNVLPLHLSARQILTVRVRLAKQENSTGI